MDLSALLDAKKVLSGEKQMKVTISVWPSNNFFYCPVLKSQKRMDLSTLPDAIVVLSGEKQMELTASV
jgi:hypothetical protein